MRDILPCKGGNRQNDCSGDNGERSKADQAAILIVLHTGLPDLVPLRVCDKTLHVCCGDHVVPVRLLGPKKVKSCYT